MLSSMAKKYANNDGKGNRRGFDPQEREEMIVKYAYLVKRIAGRMQCAFLPVYCLTNL